MTAEANLTLEEESAAEAYLKRYGRQYWTSYMLYTQQDPDHFPPHIFEQDGLIQAAQWWKYMQRKAKKSESLSLEFTEFMTKLHSCPASSGSIERWFSTVGFVWSKVRNRLGPEKAKKLSSIYRCLRQPDE